jgi:HSP20 family molecular chaperone IbpA
MALIPHNLFPRSMFDMDQWNKPSALLGPNTMDLFDPFDELDHTIGRNMQWLNKPEFLQPLALLPRVPQKYRITVDCVGYQPNSIKTDLQGHKLVVSAREDVRHDGNDDFHVREFKKTYVLPERCETDKMVSFMTSHGQLVIEFPLRETQLHLNQELFPKIVDGPNNTKNVELSFRVPENIHPEKVHVSIKDRDLIVKAEDKIEKPDGVSKFYYYKRTTLPENTNFDDLKCNYDNHQISITAPLNLNFKPYKHVPIEHTQKMQIKHH